MNATTFTTPTESGGCRGCDEQPHPVYFDCKSCNGSGHVIGGDDYRPCPSCRLRARPIGKRPCYYCDNALRCIDHH